MQLKTRGVLLALVAVFAMSAVTAAAASAALPEFKPVPTKKKFTATSGEVVLNDAGRNEIFECSKSSTTGEIIGARTVGHVVEVLTGCLGGNPNEKLCPVNSKGAKAEEIVTKPLAGELGTVAKTEASSEVGLLLHAESKTSQAWYSQEGKCIISAVVEGSLAGAIGAPTSKSVKHELAFHVVSGKQGIREIKLDSGTLEDPALEYGASTETYEASSSTLTFEEAVEI
jgi:hypothetical protein